MRLGIVGPAAPYRGGIAHYTTSLYQATKSRFPCIVISFARQYPRLLFPGKTQEDRSSSALESVGQRILDPTSRRTWNVALKALEEFRADTVLFQWWQPFFGWAYSTMMRELDRRDVSSLVLCHNVVPHEQRPWPISAFESYWTRKTFAFASGFLVHSDTLADQVRQFRPDAVMRRIYHPVYEFFGTSSPTHRADGPLRILFFGKVRQYKGLEILIQALNLLEDKLEFEAVIAGEFYLPEASFRRRLSPQVAHQVSWINRYIPNDEVAPLFTGADVLVLPYLRASQSGIIPQSYQFELPVIASDVGGLSEVVIPGETGYLFPGGSPEALADRLIEFDLVRRSRSFGAAIREFRARLSWGQVVDKIHVLAKSLG